MTSPARGVGRFTAVVLAALVAIVGSVLWLPRLAAAASTPAVDLSGACGSITGNLVQNCSFETGDFTSWDVASDLTGVYTPGFHEFEPEDGSYFAGDGSTGKLGTISQTVTGTVDGTTYDLSWWQGNEGGDPNQALVRVSDTKGGTVTLYSATNESAYGFTHFVGSFTASAPNPTLMFAYQNDAAYDFLDNVTVVPAPPIVATKLVVDAPETANGGEPTSVTVTAEDDLGQVATGYTGTVHISTSDGQADLPADATLTDGTGTFPITLNTAGSQTITATDTSTGLITGSATVNVAAAAATQLVVAAPASAAVGSPVDVTVKAEDAFGNVDSSFADFVHLSSSDSAAGLPANAKLTDGAGVFPVTFNSAGKQTITATDATHSQITGSGTVSVGTPVAATHLGVDAPATATTGSPVEVTVTAEGAGDATATGYSGTVHLTSSDGSAALPADATLTDGVGTFTVTFNTTGSQTITATDTVMSAITGSDTVAVSSGASLSLTTTTAGSTQRGLTAHVTSTSPGTPSGTVSFAVNGRSVGSAGLAATGDASLPLTLGAGTRTITATYSGDTTFAGSSDQSVVTGPTVRPTLSSKHAKTKFGWYRSPVTVTFACTSGSGSATCPKQVRLTKQGRKVTYDVTVVASDGGRARAHGKVKLDRTKPTVHVKGVRKGATYSTRRHLVCKAHDALSHVASCVIYTHTDGSTVHYVAKAKDKAGNTTTRKGDYDLKKGTTV